MSRFFSEKYSTLVPYTPGEQPQDRKYVKLNTNESPFPPSKAVAEAVENGVLTEERINESVLRILAAKMQVTDWKP